MSDAIEMQSDRADRAKSDGSDLTKPWTIKGIGWEARNAAIAAADREDMTIGAWLERAIRQTVQSDRKADRAPTVIEPVRPAAPAGPTVDLGELDRMMSIAERIHAMTGKPLPADLRSKAHKLLRVGLVSMAGPTEKPRKSDRSQPVGPDASGSQTEAAT